MGRSLFHAGALIFILKIQIQNFLCQLEPFINSGEEEKNRCQVIPCLGYFSENILFIQ